MSFKLEASFETIGKLGFVRNEVFARQGRLIPGQKNGW
jgi:hypothetical protein